MSRLEPTQLPPYIAMALQHLADKDVPVCWYEFASLPTETGRCVNVYRHLRNRMFIDICAKDNGFDLYHLSLQGWQALYSHLRATGLPPPPNGKNQQQVLTW